MNLNTISFAYQGKVNICLNIGLKGCKLASQIHWYPFFLRPWGQYKAIKNFNQLYTKALKFFKVNWGHFEMVFKNFSLDPLVVV
jgi:hypothetical protein